MTDRPRLVDVNVLVALAIDTHIHHHAAHRALAQMSSWATCPVTESGLMRVLLTPAVSGRHITASEIAGFLSGIRHDGRWQFFADQVTWSAMRIDATIVTGRQQVTDFHLVELAARNDAVLATFDGRLPRGLAPADRHLVEVLSV